MNPEEKTANEDASIKFFVGDLAALEKEVRALDHKTPVPDELQSKVRMLFNEALAGGPNMNGDAGPTLSANHALDCVWATMRIRAVQLECWPEDAPFKENNLVTTRRKPIFRGRVCGWYRNADGRLGFTVENADVEGLIHIYPTAALDEWDGVK